MVDKISFVTNATLQDGKRLKIFLPAVISVFDSVLEELIVIVDRKPESGRIKKLHVGTQNLFFDPEDILLELKDPRIRFENLDYSKVTAISSKWFSKRNVIRCQAGTPIFAFLYGIEICKLPYIVRSDCDILFSDSGFIEKAKHLLPSFDLLQMPFLNNDLVAFSSRCFYVNMKNLERKLPLKISRLDPIRQLHRMLKLLPTYMALEQTLERNIQMGIISCYRFTTEDGYSMHIPYRKDFDNLESIADRFIKGQIPSEQLSLQHDFSRAYWQ